jgi:predicted amidohydrolase
MQSINRSVPITDSTIRIALVQLRSPFEQPNPELSLVEHPELGPPQFVWRSHTAEKRKAIVRPVLEFLGTFRPHLIAFPEYALPADSHDQLQEYADKESCIIVPGSYYDRNTESPTYRNNITRIFIPGQEPLSLAKHDRFGMEQKVLAEEPASPNIAHLTWQTANGAAIGITVFICRDYLVPYDQQHRSLLDWERPGLNLVIMHSRQTQLFDAQAGLDVRRLRGQGRFVALCNCGISASGEPLFTGTALLGPTKETRRKEGDLIERLPSNAQGILTAEIDLSDVRLIETRPAKIEHDPLHSVRRYSILQDETDHILFDPLGDPAPVERGVWHPALLEVLQRNITIVLRKSRRYREVAITLGDPSSNKIRFVSACGLLGEQDFLFRLYEDAAEKLPLASTPYSSLPKAEQDRLFEGEAQKYVVEPKNIYKYRTTIVPHNRQDWEDKIKVINNLLPGRANRKTRRKLLSALCRLARNWNDREVTDELRGRVQPFFLNQPEIVPKIGANSGNSLRRRYMMVSLTHPGPQQADPFERHIIRNWLILVPEVRSLYKVITKGDSTPFHYWIDIVSDPYQADAILFELQRRCEDEKIEIGTRSIDVMEQLRHESIEGIENTDFGEETCRFMQEVSGVELDTAKLLENDQFLFDWAREWDTQHAIIDPALVTQGRENITQFYRCFCASNFATRPNVREQNLRDAASVWIRMYQDLETACQNLLMLWTNISDDRKLEEHLKSFFSARGIPYGEVKGDKVRMLLEYMHQSDPERTFPDVEDMKAVRRQFSDTLRGFRNDMTHEATSRKKAALSIRDMPLNDRASNAHRVTEATRILTDMLNATMMLFEEERRRGGTSSM